MKKMLGALKRVSLALDALREVVLAIRRLIWSGVGLLVTLDLFVGLLSRTWK